jgi:hypothetical protein
LALNRSQPVVPNMPIPIVFCIRILTHQRIKNNKHPIFPKLHLPGLWTFGEMKFVGLGLLLDGYNIYSLVLD